MSQTVFISYSAKNIQEVTEVTDRLQQAGISYWKAPEMIPAGSNYAREIPKAIAVSKVFLLIISKESQQSIWVEKELDCAINHGVTVVPVRIDRQPLCEVFRFYLNNVQTIDCFDHPKRGLLQMELRLRTLLDGRTGLQNQDERLGNQDLAHRRRMRAKVLSPNEIPVICEHCGGEIRKVSEGKFQCKVCHEYSYDSFHKIREYLERSGARSITQIAEATGVPKESVEFFLKEGRLDISNNSIRFLKCEKCGMTISSGRLCDYCKLGNGRVGIRNDRLR